MKIIEKILSFLPYLLVFFGSLYHPIDSDLGWHLKYGEYFYGSRSILEQNMFSTEMTAYKWTNSSWMTDVISYFVFNNFGFMGLAAFGAIVVVITFLFISLSFKMDFYEKALVFPLLLFLLSPMNSVSFRGQLLSLMLLAVVVFVINTYLEKKNILIFALLPLFAFWSNLHGQFILGLGLLWLLASLALIKEILIEKTPIRAAILEHKLLLICALLSPLFALINPFGVAIYFESIKHFANPLQKYVAEWTAFEELSGYWTSQVVVGILMFLGVLFATFSGKLKENFNWLVVVSLFFVLSLTVRRFAWPMYYLSVPVLLPLVTFVKSDDKKVNNILGTFIVLFSFAILFFVANPISRIKQMSWESYCDKFLKCSDGAMNYLVQNKPDGKLLTLYGWGGWMIWNYPEIKPSVDGRMHLWRDETGYSAFSEYYLLEQANRNIDNSKYDAVLMSVEKPLYTPLDKLTDAGKWKKVYEDGRSGVFVRNR